MNAGDTLTIRIRELKGKSIHKRTFQAQCLACRELDGEETGLNTKRTTGPIARYAAELWGREHIKHEHSNVYQPFFVYK